MLRGVFRLEERIGAGGMGIVYRATDTILRRDVAIKALTRITRNDVARVRREARAMAAISHPNLAIIHGVEIWHGLPFLVQEYLPGGTLSDRIASNRPSVAEVVDFGITLSGVLNELHSARIVHCDIKPSNIGFTKQGVVKLLDFGLARIVHGSHLTDSTAEGVSSSLQGWFGTPRYMSPEAARVERPTAAFDLWALGVVMYELLTGTVPFVGSDAETILEAVISSPLPDVRERNANVPEWMAVFLKKALAKDQAIRYESAVAFGDALRQLQS
jgi:serine/threonine protein kinase